MGRWVASQGGRPSAKRRAANILNYASSKHKAVPSHSIAYPEREPVSVRQSMKLVDETLVRAKWSYQEFTPNARADGQVGQLMLEDFAARSIGKVASADAGPRGQLALLLNQLGRAMIGKGLHTPANRWAATKRPSAIWAAEAATKARREKLWGGWGGWVG